MSGDKYNDHRDQSVYSWTRRQAPIQEDTMLERVIEERDSLAAEVATLHKHLKTANENVAHLSNMLHGWESGEYE